MVKALIPILCLIAVGATVHAADVTADGTAIMGVNNTGGYALTGVNYNQQSGLSTPTNITDANVNSFNATFFDGGLAQLGVYDSSYFGIAGGSLLTATSTQAITSVQVVFGLFSDGGWFGHNGQDANPLTSAILVEPTLQVTTDGINWTDVADTSNYISTLTGIDHSSYDTQTPVVTFTLVDPQANIDGIRLIGTNGGYAGDGDGFIGVNDLKVFASTIPEPSTYAMMLGGLALLASRLRRTLA